MYYLVALFVVILDQLTKWWIVSEMTLGERIPIIENFLYITSHRNQGAAWGILQGQMTFFYIVTVFVVIFIVYYIQKYGKENPFFGYTLGILLGGAIGNFIDRLFRKEVVDFIDVYPFGYNFPIFNVADSALTIGVLLMIIYILFIEGKQQKKE
ncbi:MAG: signal peptidase II [Caldibacillus sp.]